MQHLDLAMDIRKWLAETDQAVHPEEPAVEPFLLPKQPESAPHAGRRCKRASTDSSLLKAPSPQPRRKGVPAMEQDYCEVRDAMDRTRSDACHSTRCESASNSSTSQRYTRQPRRKMRLDRYEAVMTKRDKEQDMNPHSNRKRESKKSKHKSRRKKVEKTHSGIGQEFHAKNVSKDRLTLKPFEKMGLFSKGRTSTSIKGYGLPDLVFSEMKFLQNEHSGPEISAEGPKNKKRRKKDHAQTKEEDISAFFTSARPAQADVDSNIQAKVEQQTPTTLAPKTGRRERLRERSKAPDAALLTVESRDKTLHSEFGSEGRREGTSYVSCSKSVRTSSIAPVHHDDAYTAQQKQSAISRWNVNGAPSPVEAPRRQRATSSEVREPLTTAARRLRFPSVTSLPSGLSRSQSLPQRSSSPRRPNLVDRVVDRRTTADVPSAMMTSPVLRTCCSAGLQKLPLADSLGGVRSIAASCADHSVASADRRVPDDLAGKSFSNESLQGSSSLGGVLQHCNDASWAQLHRITPRQIHRAVTRSTPEAQDVEQQSKQRSYRSIAQLPTVRFLAPHTEQFRPSNFSGRSIYAQQEQQQHLPMHLNLDEYYKPRDPESVGQGYTGGSGLLDQEGPDDFSDHPVSNGSMEGFGDDVVGVGYVSDDIEHIRKPEHTDFIATGFWRPNKLY